MSDKFLFEKLNTLAEYGSITDKKYSFVGGKGAVLGEAVRFIGRDGLIQWSHDTHSPCIDIFKYTRHSPDYFFFI